MEQPITEHDIRLHCAGHDGEIRKYQFKDRRNGNVLREFETNFEDSERKANEVYDELFISLFS